MICIVVGMILLLVHRIGAAESYVCVEEMATGFAPEKNGKGWKEASFNAKDKFVIRKPKPGETGRMEYAWVVTTVGMQEVDSYCDKDFDKYGAIRCRGFYHFNFNKRSLRFLKASTMGYWEATQGAASPLGTLTPYMSIGKCSSL